MKWFVQLLLLTLTTSALAASMTQRTITYRYDVAPLLARMSCASAKCDGGATAKTLTLSLFGGDLEATAMR